MEVSLRALFRPKLKVSLCIADKEGANFDDSSRLGV